MTPIARQMAPLAEETTALLKALAHPARLMICCQLRGGERSVGDLEEILGVKQPRLSRELGKLREEGLLETRRASKVVFYRLAETSRVGVMIDAVSAVMLGEGAPSPNAAAQTRASQTPLAKSGGCSVFVRPMNDE